MPYRYPIPFGKYLLVQRVAVGGMAEVFKSKLIGPRGFEKTLALKKILPEYSQDEDFIQMFVDEARISSHLHHANIVQVYDFGEVSGAYYIAMEYVDGPNLKHLFQRTLKSTGRFPQEIAIFICLEVAKALEYAHNVSLEGEQVLNLVHRDISPQNILISRNAEVKITDFGIAKANIKLTKTQPGKVQGKLSYMSPEQATGRSIDRRSDIFSLGIIIYELLTGEKVYASGSTGEKYVKIRSADINPIQEVLPDLDSELSVLIMSMLAKEPDDRPAHCGVVIQTLSDILNKYSADEIQSRIRDLVATYFPPEKSDSSLGRRIQAAVERGGFVEELQTRVDENLQLVTEPTDPDEEITNKVDKEEPTKAIRTQPWLKWVLLSTAGMILGLALVWMLSKPKTKPEKNKPVEPIAQIEDHGESNAEPPNNLNTGDEPELNSDFEANPPPLNAGASSPSSEPATNNSMRGPVDVDIREEAIMREMEMRERIRDLETQVKEAEEVAKQKAKEAKSANEKLEAQKIAKVQKAVTKCPGDMVYISSGDFYFGSPATDPDRNALVEIPEKMLSFAKGYCIDIFEFPNQKGARPRTLATWSQALDLCSGQKKRLCTQEEWERACRGSIHQALPHRVYPYGSRWKSNACSVIESDEALEDQHLMIATSGAHPQCKSIEGVFDLIGNAEEWTQTQGLYGAGNRVIKGGSLSGPAYLARCSSRREIPAQTSRDELGFRCCKDSP